MAQRYLDTGNANEYFLTLLNEAAILITLGDPGGAISKLDEAKRSGAGEMQEYALDEEGHAGASR